MSKTVNQRKSKKIDTDSDDDDDEQIRKFLEAADSSLLNNSLYKKNLESTNVSELSSTILEMADGEPKTQRYLNEELVTGASDLQITKEMQTHIWGKLSTNIEHKIKFRDPKQPSSGSQKEELPWPNKVKLVSEANCYVVDDIEEVIKQKKPKIEKRRLNEENQLSEDAALAAVSVSGEFILQGEDTKSWFLNTRKDKLYKYKAMNEQGNKLILLEDTKKPAN